MFHAARKKNNRSAFTLIELLVVVAIIGILSTIVIASVNTARRRSRDSRRQQDMKSIQTALDLYYDSPVSNGAYIIQTTTTTAAADAATALATLVTDGHIPQIAIDPLAGGAYYYVSNASGSNYCLTAEMEGAITNDGCISSLNTAMDTITGASTANDYRVGP
ncbi:MAG: protein ral secretion pathway protein [Candidatus Parcubacteria bacterium]